MLTAEIHPDGIATLCLDQSERRNALSIAMRDAISDTLEVWTADDRVRVVVLTTAGSTFCAGFDLKEFAKPELAKTIRDSSRRYHLAVWQFPKPVIAPSTAPRSVAVSTSACCSICASRRRTPSSPTPRSSSAPPALHALAVDRRRGHRAQLCLTGRRVDAAEAHRIGVVNTIVDAERLEDEAMSAARVMAEAPQPALEATKRYLVSNAGLTSAMPSRSNTTASSTSFYWVTSRVTPSQNPAQYQACWAAASSLSHSKLRF